MNLPATTQSLKSSRPSETGTKASSNDAKAALRGLFATFPTRDHSDPTAVLGTYLIAIDGYSLKAIQGAIRRIIRGEVAEVSPKFLPTPAELSTVVRYVENLYSPPQTVRALPAPGDTRDDSPEGIAARTAVVERYWRKPKATIPQPETEKAPADEPTPSEGMF